MDNLIIAVVVSSAVGYYGGFSMERKKARRVLRRLMHEAAQSTTRLVATAVELLAKKGGVEQKDAADELIKACNENGMGLEVLSEQQARKMGLIQ